MGTPILEEKPMVTVLCPSTKAQSSEPPPMAPFSQHTLPTHPRCQHQARNRNKNSLSPTAWDHFSGAEGVLICEDLLCGELGDTDTSLPIRRQIQECSYG